MPETTTTTTPAPFTSALTESTSTGFLSRMLDSIRTLTDEPIIQAKYTSARLIKLIQEQYLFMMTDVNQASVEPIVVPYEITPVSGQSVYILPATAGKIYCIYLKYYGSTGPKMMWAEYDRRSSIPNFYTVEAGTIRFNLTDYPTVFEGVDTIYVDYVPNGCAKLFEAIGHTIGTNTASVAYTAAGSNLYLGEIDKRVNAYVGSILRLIPATTSVPQQDRRITSVTFGSDTLIFTVDQAWSPSLSAETCVIGVVPPYPEGFDAVVAYGVAAQICGIEANVARANTLQKMAYDKLAQLRVLVGGRKGWRGQTVHRNNYRTSKRVLPTMRRF